MFHRSTFLGALAITALAVLLAWAPVRGAANGDWPAAQLASLTGDPKIQLKETSQSRFEVCGGAAFSCTIYLPFVVKAPEALGTVRGKVVDATTVRGLSGATVCVPTTGQCAIADNDGSYVITGVPAGRRGVRASANGFTALEQRATVLTGGVVTLNFALSPNLAPGEMRIVVTWSDLPQDLDAHLWLPAATPYHIHFANKGYCTAFPSACLDVDDQTGDGPETVTIRQSYAGRYVFAVYNWSDEVPIAQSAGRVVVYGAGGVVAAVSTPLSGNGRWWHVFDLDGATGELTIHNAIQTTAPAPYVSEVEGTVK